MVCNAKTFLVAGKLAAVWACTCSVALTATHFYHHRRLRVVLQISSRPQADLLVLIQDVHTWRSRTEVLCGQAGLPVEAMAEGEA
jgi:hypothetical protein